MARIFPAAVTAVTLHILVFATVIPWGVTGQNVITIWYVALVVGGLNTIIQFADRAGRREILRLLSGKPALALYRYIFLYALFSPCQTPDISRQLRPNFSSISALC